VGLLLTMCGLKRRDQSRQLVGCHRHVYVAATAEEGLDVIAATILYLWCTTMLTTYASAIAVLSAEATRSAAAQHGPRKGSIVDPTVAMPTTILASSATRHH
jgi:hypothetical protein